MNILPNGYSNSLSSASPSTSDVPSRPFAAPSRSSTWQSLQNNPVAFKGGSTAPRSNRLQQLAREVIRQEHPVSVKSVPGTSIVHVSIKGDSDTFAAVGMAGIDSSNGLKRVEYLSLPADKYTPHLAGGKNEQYRMTSMSSSERKSLLSSNQSLKSRVVGAFSRSTPPAHTAFINGGFYGNLGVRSDEIGVKKYATHAPIGDAKVKGVKQVEGVRPQDAYSGDYHRVTFPNGSYVTLAPKMAAPDEATGRYTPQFTAEKAAQPKYIFENTPLNRPGELGHMSHPNPRSGIDLPASTKSPEATCSKTNNIRLAIACDDSGVRGANSHGMTGKEWSTVLARLGGFNANPGEAHNCDGGMSSLMGVVDKRGEPLLMVRAIEGSGQVPTAANFIAVSANKKE